MKRTIQSEHRINISLEDFINLVSNAHNDIPENPDIYLDLGDGITHSFGAENEISIIWEDSEEEV